MTFIIILAIAWLVYSVHSLKEEIKTKHELENELSALKSQMDLMKTRLHNLEESATDNHSANKDDIN